MLSEIPVRYTPGGEGHRIPHLLVAFKVERLQAIEQNGYSIHDQGKPPDFVLEIASVTTPNLDITDKRRDYASFGIPEYWRFDPTGGKRYDRPIAGDRLAEGIDQPVEIRQIAPEHLHGHSGVLKLDLCWDHGQLRWFDPAAQSHLLTFDEERVARIAEQEARISEREARLAAEARVRELEAQLRDSQQD